MEILALITINIAFGFGLYVFISAKMNRTLKDSQGVQLEKKVRSVYAEFIRESNHSIDILDSKMKGLRDLIQRAEKIQIILQEDSSMGSGVSMQLQNLINTSKDVLDHKIPNLEIKKNPNSIANQIPIPYPFPDPAPNAFALGVAKAYTENEPIVTNKVDNLKLDSSNLLAQFGAKVKEIVGGAQFAESEKKLAASSIPEIKTESNVNKLAYLIDGDPFTETADNSYIRDLHDEKRKENEEGSYLSTYKEISNKMNPSPRDRITISPESALSELPESATKIDKAVHLLTKGFSHSEVADALNIGFREVTLIETVKMEKSRRR
jgi:hypothetical protein